MLSHLWLFATPWTVTRQAPLSMGVSKQEYWSGLTFPTPGDLPDPGIEPESLTSPSLVGRSFTTSTTWKARNWARVSYYSYEWSSYFSLFIPFHFSSLLPSYPRRPVIFSVWFCTIRFFFFKEYKHGVSAKISVNRSGICQWSGRLPSPQPEVLKPWAHTSHLGKFTKTDMKYS